MNDSGACFMYVGNLEVYQGIDLLLKSFVLVLARRPSDRLVVIGGTDDDIEKYRKMAAALRIDHAVDFRGPKPISEMAEFLREADILVSPRIKGSNTPMKIYSYLHSGKPVVATDLFTHTQVLTPDVAMLAAPEPGAFAGAMCALAGDAALRERMGNLGRELVRTRYSPEAFKTSMTRLYNMVEAEVNRLRSERAAQARPTTDET